MHPLLPALTLILWTFCVGLTMGIKRNIAVRSGETRLKDVALNNTAWSAENMKWGNNFNNLFQVPVIFYALMIMASLLKYSPTWLIYVAWAFVFFRLLHTIIHVTNNIVIYRFAAFIAANLCNMAIALALFFHLWSIS